MDGRGASGDGAVRYTVGCDIGGTFTDLVLLGSDGSIRTHKLASTPDDYGRAIVQGIEEIAAFAGVTLAAIDGVVHATTVATNTILEFKGARTALVTTSGFRDVLEMRRLRIPVLYDLQYDKPPPLAPRRLRFEVAERMGPRGEIWRALDEDDARAVARRIREAGVDAVAICFLHAYANPAHEHRVATILAEELGRDVFICCSADVLAEIREYERCSTTVVNAYVGPMVARYLRALENRLRERGVSAPLRIMQSNGGVMTATAAASRPATIVESGPAAGVIAGARIAARAGLANVISFDMGGTTAKAAIIENGMPAKTSEYEVGAGINLSSKLVKGGGYAIKLPFIDVSEIGAGGGSIVGVDSAGTLKVGPRSAGAMPGPACYDLGGVDATFTDAMVTLGYLNPTHLVGGRMRIHVDRAQRAIDERVAAPLHLSRLDAAHGVLTLAVANMTRAVKAVSTYRGRDPRDFALIAFGGNGPVVAAMIARALDMKRVLIPPVPGVFSALGLVFSDVEHDRMRTIFRRVDAITAIQIEEELAALAREASAPLLEEGAAAVTLRREADLRYSGQAYELTVALDEKLDRAVMLEAFHAEHARTYGHRQDGAPVDLINLRVIASAPQRSDLDAAQATTRAAELASKGHAVTRQVYFGAARGLLPTRVIARGDLSVAPLEGPLIVEEFDATCVIPPGARASLDAVANIVIDVAAVES
jgi:N-methylhydantoinase A